MLTRKAKVNILEIKVDDNDNLEHKTQKSSLQNNQRDRAVRLRLWTTTTINREKIIVQQTVF